MLPLEQEHINEQTVMKAQHCNSGPPNISILSSLSLELGPAVNCDEGGRKEETPQSFQTETFFPCWDKEAEDDDSQSCEWSIESSNTFSDQGCWDDGDAEETVELDEYLIIPMERRTITCKRVIKFDDDPVSAVYNYEKPAQQYYKNLYYTVHELQSMIDKYIQSGGNHNFLSSSC
mmetsp:Transcript_2874/g.4273  ORF Transcript_2874/g.4273 Transcript_2874/m.4273 type:complete len:176 (+) Transcript_2874:117-644(+)